MDIARVRDENNMTGTGGGLFRFSLPSNRRDTEKDTEREI
jgi:hypothetical protein